MIETLAYIVTLGLFGYAFGRLIARESVLDPIRRPVLNWLGGPSYRMAVAEAAALGEGAEVVLDTRTFRGYVIDGLTCPSCVGFYWVIIGHWLFHDQMWIGWDLYTNVVVVFAAWAVTGICVRRFQ